LIDQYFRTGGAKKKIDLGIDRAFLSFNPNPSIEKVWDDQAFV